jgi:hypothetical protein
MSIRLPLTTVLSASNNSEIGAGSVAGGIPLTFTIPQDADNVVVKFTASVAGAGVSAVFQTTDDGGTTYYDVARTSIVSNANNTTAEWLSIPVISAGIGMSTSASAGNSSVVGATIGSAAASVLGSRQYSGMPLLSQQGRVFLRITGNITSAASNVIQTQVKVNSQSATA